MRLLSYLTLLAAFCQCTAKASKDTDPLLARVHNYELRFSDASKYLGKYQTPADSISQLRIYVEQWVRDAVLLNEAEQSLPPDLELNDLIRDYRSSLIISNYEKLRVERELDTVISTDELRAYYQANKDQYQLERPIMRCMFIKLGKDVEELGEFRPLWNSDDPEDFDKMVELSMQYAEIYMLDDSAWYKVEDIESMMPRGTFSADNVRPNTSRTFSDNEYDYYLRISETILSTEIAPLSYIKEQAVRYIMHKRKLELLTKLKSDLYARDMRDNNISIFVE